MFDKPKHFKPLFVRAKIVIQEIKKGDASFVYAIPTFDLGTQQHEILVQYQEHKYVFEKKIAIALPKHQPYDCVIDLEKGT
jgi:hypothetical protein